MRKQIVYLAGGFKPDWHEKVEMLTNIECVNPKTKEMKKEVQPSEYGCWDLHFIKQCDILFCYVEKTNPSGVGLACEIGYAKAIGKTVVLVLETAHEQYRYFRFLESVSDVVYDNLDDAIRFLKSF